MPPAVKASGIELHLVRNVDCPSSSVWFDVPDPAQNVSDEVKGISSLLHATEQSMFLHSGDMHISVECAQSAVHGGRLVDKGDHFFPDAALLFVELYQLVDC